MLRGVSVVIPCHNGARYLGEAIDSVLAQTHEPLETIVIDANSVDETPAVCARYGERVRYVRSAAGGPAGARNAGIELARGAYVAFLDHDDRFLREKLARQVELLDAHPDTDVVFTGWDLMDGEGRPLPGGWTPPVDDVLPYLLLGHPIYPSAVLVRRETFARFGMFDTTRRRLEDLELWLRWTLRGVRWARVDAQLLVYRLHDEQRTQKTHQLRLTPKLEILRETFADPNFPPAMRHLEAPAFQNAYLFIAARLYRTGERAEAGKLLRAAARARPAFLVDRRSLRDFCALLLPPGTPFLPNWRSATGSLREALHDLFAERDLEPDIARLRWRARLALLSLRMRSARKARRAKRHTAPELPLQTSVGSLP